MEKARPQALLLSTEQEAWDEERDELGLIPLDYEAMQQESERKGKLSDELKNGWDITPEQVKLINSPRHPFHSVAVNTFYDVNFKRLRRMAYAFLRKRNNLLKVVDHDDLTQQVYCDMLCGFLKLPTNTANITYKIYECFKFAAVGGLEGVYDVKAI